jgi:hypothetical protein
MEKVLDLGLYSISNSSPAIFEIDSGEIDESVYCIERVSVDGWPRLVLIDRYGDMRLFDMTM